MQYEGGEERGEAGRRGSVSVMEERRMEGRGREEMVGRNKEAEKACKERETEERGNAG